MRTNGRRSRSPVSTSLYVDPASRQVRVSIDLEDTEPWLLRNDKDSTVPMRIYIQGVVTFED